MGRGGYFRCPACGYWAFDGVRCWDCGWRPGCATVPSPPLELWRTDTEDDAWTPAHAYFFAVTRAQVDHSGRLALGHSNGTWQGEMRVTNVDPAWEAAIMEWFEGHV